ncbi:Protein of unknown function [Prauserella marina]|uniref:Uncharacterized protein n=1 Tax=Prauserella marina TaxID=530584 RepID=A0A1G6KNV2_9PSEU|nr:lipopolysaccharide assembly protein LapA domain-containing protein [Prauserella marina]PWV84033.1 uncharacterized protein DUF1049 [Prauserella marina]SDC32026.1 Protein of unknown function [Prauserella marina]
MSTVRAGWGRAIGTKLRAVPVTTWLALAIVVVALVFVLQNRNETSVHLFGAALTAPLWLTLLFTFLAGVLAGWLGKRRRTRR